MLAWRVYYGDGTTFDAAGGVENAPERDVAAIVQRAGEGNRVEHGTDFYWWLDNGVGWCGGDLYGLWDYLARPGWKRVLFGRTVPRSDYNRIVGDAIADPDFTE